VAQTFIALGQRVRKGERLLVLDSVELGEAKSAYRKAKARLEVTGPGYERERRLFEDGRIASEKEMLEARGAYLEARAEFEAAEERLHLYGFSQEEIGRIGPEHDPGVSLFPVVSPLSGTVTEKQATLGETARPEETVCTVADLSTLWIILNIYEKDIARVRVGQEAAVRVDAHPGKAFEGRLTYIGAALDEGTRTVEGRVEIDNASEALKPGMFATVTVIERDPGAARQALTVPAAAVQKVGTSFVVFVREGETRFERRDIVTGEETAGEVAVIAGLKEGEEVVTEGSFVLKSELLKGEMEGHED
jgi:cobalt-zinc-cadmium efflux system membrane fusion protein